LAAWGRARRGVRRAQTAAAAAAAAERMARTISIAALAGRRVARASATRPAELSAAEARMHGESLVAEKGGVGPMSECE
jgi:hypothetical protein